MRIFTRRIQGEGDIVGLAAPTIRCRILPNLIVGPLFYIALLNHVVVGLVASRLAVVVDGTPFRFTSRALHPELIAVIIIVTTRQTFDFIVLNSPNAQALISQFDLPL